MKRGFYLKFFLAVALVIILYLIWPVPFWYFSKKILLPAGEKASDLAKVSLSPLKIVGNLNSLDKKNKTLEQENQNLKAENSRIKDEARSCQTIGQESKISRLHGFEVATAKIIGRTPQTFNQKVVVDKGAADLVKEGSAVLSNGYLVGRVRKVEQHQSEIQLITSHDSLVPAISEKTRDSGLVQGGLEGLTLIDVPANAKIEIGDRVVTSGLGGDFPSGLIIAETAKLMKGQGLFQTVKLYYPLEISQLEVVSIIK